MGRKHINRRGKKSRKSTKNAFRSHDPELNGGKEKIYVGRNSAPAKTDESVLNTTLTLKEPRVFQPPVEESSVPVVSGKQSKLNRHEELRKSGEEKRRLLSALALKGSVAVEVTTPRPSTNDSRRKDLKRKYQEAASERSKNGSVIKTSILSSTPIASTKHTEHKRQKMRAREREKRTKTIEKKAVKRMDSTEKRIFNKPAFGEVMEKPSDAIRDMGIKLAQKLVKGKSAFTLAYDKIKK